MIEKAGKFAGPGFLLLSLTGCRGAQSALDPAGPQSNRAFGLLELFTGVSAVVYLCVAGFLVYALWRSSRDRDLRPGEIPKQRRAAIIVAVCTAVTTVILTVFLIQSIAKAGAMSIFPPNNTLEVDVIAHQWWWEFQYANPSAEMRVLTANELHIPVGRPVNIVTESRDVIHSFWIPNLHGKLDAIPNHDNRTWIQADRAGSYRGQCAEYCGLQHAHMSFVVIAEPEKDFDAWLAGQRQPGRTPATPNRQLGQQVFLAASCVICHRVRGTSALGLAAPDLTHFGSRHTIAAGTVPNTPGYLAGWITDSQHLKPGNRMPPINLQPGSMQPLLDYLESLK